MIREDSIHTLVLTLIFTIEQALMDLLDMDVSISRDSLWRQGSITSRDLSDSTYNKIVTQADSNWTSKISKDNRVTYQTALQVPSSIYIKGYPHMHRILGNRSKALRALVRDMQELH